MKEELFQFAWKNLVFDFNGLQTQYGDPVFILHPGHINRNAGPDFSLAKIRIGENEWRGDVELHIESSEWYLHGHHRDPAYNSVILHVCLQSKGRPVLREDGTRVPEILLAGKLSPALESCYLQFQLSKNAVPCSGMLASVPRLHTIAWLDRLGCERLEEKASRMAARLQQTRQNWEQLIWEEMAAGLGGTTNADPFRELARIVPFSMIRKYHHQTRDVLALLMGVAGILKANADPRLTPVETQWNYIRHKHSLEVAWVPLRNGKNRPPALPLNRLLQMAAFSIHFPEPGVFLNENCATVLLQEEIDADFPLPYIAPGRQTREHLLINTLLPILWLYGKTYGRGHLSDTASAQLELLPAENHRFTRMFASQGLVAENALQSQGLLRLYQSYCGPRNCLTCAFGQYHLNQSSKSWKVSTPYSSSAQVLKEESPWIFSMRTA